MKVIAAHKAPVEEVEEFLTSTENNVERKALMMEGYVVEINNKIQGCFILSSMDDGAYWLKQLYITKQATVNLPVLLETILQMSKGKQAKKLYVHSHQPVVDLLLDALQFHVQKGEVFVGKQTRTNGKWWAYNVS